MHSLCHQMAQRTLHQRRLALNIKNVSLRMRCAPRRAWVVCATCVWCVRRMRQGAAHAACGRARAVRARAPPCALPPFTVTAPCLQAPRRPRASCWVGQGEGDAHRLVLWPVRCVRLRLWRVEWARAVRAVLCMRRGACSGEQGGACVVLVLVLCVQFSVCGVCVRGGAQWARGAWRRSVQLVFFSPAFGGTCRRLLH